MQESGKQKRLGRRGNPRDSNHERYWTHLCLFEDGGAARQRTQGTLRSWKRLLDDSQQGNGNPRATTEGTESCQQPEGTHQPDLPQSLQEGVQPCQQLDSASESLSRGPLSTMPSLDYNLQNCEIINGCCVKLSSGQFFTASVESLHSKLLFVNWE